MPIKLYNQDVSPLASAVKAVCDIFNVPVEIIDMDLLSGDQFKPDFLKINPCHTIPVLIHGDLIIHDSHAILMYLGEVYGNNSPLYPNDVKQRALINSKLLFNDSILFARLKQVTYALLTENQKGFTPKQIKALEEAASFLEEFLSRTKFLAMDHITIADIVAYPTVCAHTSIISLNAVKYPKINAWLKEMEKQPYCQKHIAKGIKRLGDIILRFGKE